MVSNLTDQTFQRVIECNMGCKRSLVIQPIRRLCFCFVSNSEVNNIEVSTFRKAGEDTL